MTKAILSLSCAMLVAMSAIAKADDAPPATSPVPIIFDTDIGNDVDDVLALGMIHALENLGECRLVAVTITKDNHYAAPMVDLVNTFYGRGDIPIGVVRNGVTPDDGLFLGGVVTAEDNGQMRYPHDLLDGGDAPEAVGLLRKVLAAQPDGSVVIAQVGFSTNLARLLDSKPDAASPLDGTALVKQKVRLLSAMAGQFVPMPNGDSYKEYNVVMDVPSAQRVADEWPTPIVFSGYEIGEKILFPGSSIQKDYGYVPHHPLADSYERFMKMPYDRPTWDLTSVLCAVRPEGGYFGLSQPGHVVVTDEGVTEFTPDANGLHRYLTVDDDQIAKVLADLVKLCRQPPKR